jgi:hypothetical protein
MVSAEACDPRVHESTNGLAVAKADSPAALVKPRARGRANKPVRPG